MLVKDNTILETLDLYRHARHTSTAVAESTVGSGWIKTLEGYRYYGKGEIGGGGRAG